MTLTTSVIGAFTPFAGDEFIIIDNDGTGDAVTGTFQGLAEGAQIANFLGPGRSATISYIGGDGHDVTLTSDGLFVSLDGAGNLVLTDNAGTEDAVTIQADPATVESVITHATKLIGNQVAPFTDTGTMVARVPFTAITETQISANFDTGEDALAGGTGTNSLIDNEGDDTLNNNAISDDSNVPPWGPTTSPATTPPGTTCTRLSSTAGRQRKCPTDHRIFRTCRDRQQGRVSQRLQRRGLSHPRRFTVRRPAGTLNNLVKSVFLDRRSGRTPPLETDC